MIRVHRLGASPLGGQKGRGLGGRNFCPPELNPPVGGSKFSVRIFAKKSSDFVQRSEPTIDFFNKPCYHMVSSFCTERLPYGSRVIFVLCKMYKEKIL